MLRIGDRCAGALKRRRMKRSALKLAVGQAGSACAVVTVGHFDQYIGGFTLCPIRAGDKGPDDDQDGLRRGEKLIGECAAHANRGTGEADQDCQQEPEHAGERGFHLRLKLISPARREKS